MRNKILGGVLVLVIFLSYWYSNNKLMNNLLDKKILLIICGGISAYKSLEVIRSLKKKGAKVKTI